MSESLQIRKIAEPKPGSKPLLQLSIKMSIVPESQPSNCDGCELQAIFADVDPTITPKIDGGKNPVFDLSLGTFKRPEDSSENHIMEVLVEEKSDPENQTWSLSIWGPTSSGKC